MDVLSPDRYHAALATDIERFADVVAGADLGVTVPTCPQWSLAQLAAHTGAAHRWVSAIVAERATGPVAEPVPDAPAESAELAEWLRDGVARLSAVLLEAGVDTPVWSWSADQRSGFWLRRMAHETLVHRVDAELAVDRIPVVDADAAADAVSEWLGLLAGPGTELAGDGETLHFHATDDGLGEAGEWLVRRTPDGMAWEHGHAKGDVAVRGSAAELMLVLARRAPVSTVTVFGDGALLEHWLSRTAF
ncbi:MAG: maleylpyruvate isomerase family mycothiol-dependent enzyme [Pseudonocardiaceae bacterium]